MLNKTTEATYLNYQHVCIHIHGIFGGGFNLAVWQIT